MSEAGTVVVQEYGFRRTCTKAAKDTLETNLPTLIVRETVPPTSDNTSHKHDLPTPKYDYGDVSAWLIATKNPYATLRSYTRHDLPHGPDDLTTGDVISFAGHYAAKYAAWLYRLGDHDHRPVIIVRQERLIEDPVRVVRGAAASLPAPVSVPRVDEVVGLGEHAHAPHASLDRAYYEEHAYLEELGAGTVHDLHTALNTPWIQDTLHGLGYEAAPPTDAMLIPEVQ